jgi:hypothetical protein
LLKVLLGILFLPLIYFYAGNFWDLLKLLPFDNPKDLYFIISLIGVTLFFSLFLSEGSFITIFEHEFTHNLWAILTFNKPEGLRVKKGEGAQFLAMAKGNFLLPYLPIFSLPCFFCFFPHFFSFSQLIINIS